MVWIQGGLMRDQAQLLLVSGLLMSITLIAVTSTITHSVNLGNHQGERHDMTPVITSLENSFSLALEDFSGSSVVTKHFSLLRDKAT